MSFGTIGVNGRQGCGSHFLCLVLGPVRPRAPRPLAQGGHGRAASRRRTGPACYGQQRFILRWLELAAPPPAYTHIYTYPPDSVSRSHSCGRRGCTQSVPAYRFGKTL
jgi:hypothetical protein